ncbi:hypothetical protein, partial [Photorhabdus viridis]|uniref:hypothetical protein n=1 Tax=Photorhabdus viridis TaxID=3163327 RepID=UPI00330781CB
RPPKGAARLPQPRCAAGRRVELLSPRGAQGGRLPLSATVQNPTAAVAAVPGGSGDNIDPKTRPPAC